MDALVGQGSQLGMACYPVAESATPPQCRHVAVMTESWPTSKATSSQSLNNPVTANAARCRFTMPGVLMAHWRSAVRLGRPLQQLAITAPWHGIEGQHARATDELGRNSDNWLGLASARLQRQCGLVVRADCWREIACLPDIAPRMVTV